MPSSLGEATALVGGIDCAQVKALRHLRSINRKLTALGVVARVTGVKSPRPPDNNPSTDPGRVSGPGPGCPGNG
ncbi:MAG: hypothetical protein ACRDKT_00720 [Actinomycetota bacterium]